MPSLVESSIFIESSMMEKSPWFVLFIVFYYLTLYRISTKWYCTKDFRIDMTFYLSLFTGIELLLFRSYGTTHYWIGLGMMYSYLYSHYNNDKSS